MQKMFFNSYMSIRTQLQIASHTLASSEQFQLGGADSVRGYPEGDYLADTEGVLNFDWFFPLRRQIEPVFFVDLGGGKLKKTLSGERADKQTSGLGPSTFYFSFQSEI